MQTILMSIKPKWCGLIASGKKTIEVRKTKPKLKVPFKVYIYCTANKQGVKDLLEIHGTDRKIRKANSKVIGEFMCNEITELAPLNHSPKDVEKQACLTREEIVAYIKGKGYAWHISDLVIYDTPKELCEFTAWKKCNSCRTSGYESSACIYDEDCKVPTVVIRPPQSWCYVEEKKDENNYTKR